MDGEAENLFTAEEEAETASILEAVVRRVVCVPSTRIADEARLELRTSK